MHQIQSQELNKQNHYIANLKIQIAQPLVQILANPIFNFSEAVQFLVIFSSEKGTLEFPLHYMKVVITHGKRCPSHDQVTVGTCSMEKAEFEQKRQARSHRFPLRKYLAKILRQEYIKRVLFTPEITTDSPNLSANMFCIPPVAFQYLLLDEFTNKLLASGNIAAIQP